MQLNEIQSLPTSRGSHIHPHAYQNISQIIGEVEAAVGRAFKTGLGLIYRPH